jgi:hypothetical protein
MYIQRALALAMMTGAASAQQQTYNDAHSDVVGRSATDSGGAIANCDARGKVISRETTSGPRRQTPHPSPHCVRRHPLPQGERKTAESANTSS